MEVRDVEYQAVGRVGERALSVAVSPTAVVDPRVNSSVPLELVIDRPSQRLSGDG